MQPNAYGADNACLLAAMKEYGPNTRGVAVVTPDVKDAELERLTKAGIRAVRFMLLPGGFLTVDVFDKLAARVHEVGWHVNLQIDGRTFADHEARLRKLKGDVVIDHVGKFLEPVPVDHPAFKAMLRVVAGGKAWVKLSAPYETSKLGRPLYGDVGALAKALVKANPDRMLWASNWPHPSATPTNKPNDAELLDLLLDWAPDEATRRKILVDNPARLYGFEHGETQRRNRRARHGGDAACQEPLDLADRVEVAYAFSPSAAAPRRFAAIPVSARRATSTRS